jgi:hypothetical protein
LKGEASASRHTKRRTEPGPTRTATRPTGGKIRKTDVCFKLFGAYESTATGVVTDGRCAPIIEAERGGLVPYGNTVEVLPKP